MKQTAVDWLIEKIERQRENGNEDLRATLHYCKEAKRMEREQIEESYGDGLNAYRTEFCNRHEYYNKTYKK